MCMHACTCTRLQLQRRQAAVKPSEHEAHWEKVTVEFMTDESNGEDDAMLIRHKIKWWLESKLQNTTTLYHQYIYGLSNRDQCFCGEAGQKAREEVWCIVGRGGKEDYGVPVKKSSSDGLSCQFC